LTEKGFKSSYLDCFFEQFMRICEFCQINNDSIKDLIDKMNRGCEKYKDDFLNKDLVKEIYEEFLDLFNYIFLTFVKGDIELTEAESLCYKVVIAWSEVAKFFLRKKQNERKPKCSDESCTL